MDLADQMDPYCRTNHPPPPPLIVRVTDEELVARARQGDTHAFGELVTRHQAAVVRTAFVVCRSREEADEVAQEALVSAWRRLSTFRGEAQFKTWLLTITWRHALTRRGSAWRRLFRTARQPDDAAFELRSEAPSAERSVVAAGDTLRRVHGLVDALPAVAEGPAAARRLAASARSRRWP